MLMNILSFIRDHAVVFASAGVALLDLLFALNPSSAGNGILHWIYAQLVGLQKPPSA